MGGVLTQSNCLVWPALLLTPSYFSSPGAGIQEKPTKWSCVIHKWAEQLLYWANSCLYSGTWINWQSRAQDARRITRWENICCPNCNLEGNLTTSTWVQNEKNANCPLYTSGGLMNSVSSVCAASFFFFFFFSVWKARCCKTQPWPWSFQWLKSCYCLLPWEMGFVKTVGTCTCLQWSWRWGEYKEKLSSLTSSINYIYICIKELEGGTLEGYPSGKIH